jgi:Beta-lactamase enzyme family
MAVALGVPSHAGPEVVSARGDATTTTSTSLARQATKTKAVPQTTTLPAATTVPTTVAATGAVDVLSLPSVVKYLKGREGNITAAVYDVSTQTMSVWRTGVEEQTASIEKVDILASLLQDYQEQGNPISSADQAIATGMIEQSNNNDANALWAEVGQQDGVALFNRQIAMTATTLGTQGLWGVTTTTAADQIKLLQTVALPNAILAPASQTYELGLMEHVSSSQDWGVSAGVLPGATIALKNGWLPLDEDDWQVNSIGWINGDGRNYLIAVLTDQEDTEYDGIQTIQGLSSLVWANEGVS